jgi:hypothetical protein
MDVVMRFRWSVLALGFGLCFLLLPGCKKAESPEDALRSFVSAVKAGRGESAWTYLTDEARQALETRAEAAQKAAGGDAAIEAQDLISSTGFVSPYHIAEITRDGEPSGEGRLKLKVKTHLRGDHEVWMKLQGETWRVELPLTGPAS